MTASLFGSMTRILSASRSMSSCGCERPDQALLLPQRERTHPLGLQRVGEQQTPNRFPGGGPACRRPAAQGKQFVEVGRAERCVDEWDRRRGKRCPRPDATVSTAQHEAASPGVQMKGDAVVHPQAQLRVSQWIDLGAPPADGEPVAGDGEEVGAARPPPQVATDRRAHHNQPDRQGVDGRGADVRRAEIDDLQGAQHLHRDEHDEGDEDRGVAGLPIANSLGPLGGEGGSGGDELTRRRRFVVDAHIDSVLSPAPYRSQQCSPRGRCRRCYASNRRTRRRRQRTAATRKRPHITVIVLRHKGCRARWPTCCQTRQGRRRRPARSAALTPAGAMSSVGAGPRGAAGAAEREPAAAAPRSEASGWPDAPVPASATRTSDPSPS